jgi:hypothetical protein
MKTASIEDKLRDLVKTGKTNERPWAIIRFKDLWDSGLAKVRGDKLNDALANVLRDAGIETVWQSEKDAVGYATFVSASGATIYVGKTEITDWVSTGDLFDAVKDVVTSN